MARASVTPTPLLRDAAVAQPAPTQSATTGFILPSPGPFHLVLELINGDTAAHTAVLRGSGYTGATSGAANSSMVSPANVVFTQGTTGDLAVAVPASTTEFVVVSTTDRFVQADGSLWLDFLTAISTLTFVAYTLPYVAA